jgi:zinc transport system substrate-binding protein
VPNETISTQNSSSTKAQTLDLMVSIAPQKYFVEKIGGDRLKVNVMVDPQTEPETYEPKPQQLATLSEIEAYISIGLPFEEKWLDKFKQINPQMILIDSDQGIERLEMSDHGHDHGDESSTQSTLDPHIWLSPSLVKIQAQNIYQGLIKLDPQNQPTYQKNLQQFLTEIDQLNQKINDNLAGITNRKFIVFHPAWTYFAKEYNLEQIPVEVEGQEPSAAELAQLIQTAKNSNIKVIFVQPELKTKNAQAIAQEIGGQVIMISPNDPQWAENLLKVSEIFKLNLSSNPQK